MTGWGCNEDAPTQKKTTDVAGFFASRAIMWVAALLLTLQGFIIYADTVMETYFFDELFGLAINTALVYLIAKQRAYMKKKGA